MVFRFKCYNLPFSGGGMVMWTNTHCFDFFSCTDCNLILSQYVHNYRPLRSSILIDLFKVATYLSCGEDY